MTQQGAPVPRRIVRYRVNADTLGRYICFETDDIELPKGVLPHQLPPNAKLEMTKTHWHFRPREMSAPIGAHELRRLFLEFAEAMHWEVHLDP